MLLSNANGGTPMVFQDRLAKGGLAPQMVTDLTGALPVAFSRTSITRDDFTQFVNATHHQVEADISAANRSGCTASKEARTPDVVCVGFDDARAYAAWLSDQTGSSYRLATRDELDAVRQAVERFPPSTVTPFTGGWTSELTRGVGVIRVDFHVVRDMPRARRAQSKSRS